LFTLLVMDDFGNGVPVAWMLTSDELAVTIGLALTKVKEAMEADFPGWEPSAFVVDDADGEIKAVNEVFFEGRVRVLLCIW
jgi:hypothetical protein